MKATDHTHARRSWGTVRIGDVLRLVNGRAFKPSEWSPTGTPIIRIQNLNDPGAAFNCFKGELPDKFAVERGDLLFAWSGTPGTSFGAHVWRGERAWLNQHIFKVQFNAAQFDKHFLQLAINQNLNEYIRAAHGGAGLAHITKGRFEGSELPLPPIDEQRRIVEEIEKQFTRLDAGRAALERVQRNLKRYRASVLKAACEGRLVPTEADLARAEGRSFEPASELLARILEERRANWSGRGKYKEPKPPEASTRSAVPSGWAYVGFDQVLSGVSDSGRKLARSSYLASGRYPVIDQGDSPVGGFSDDDRLVFDGELPVILFGDHTRRFKLVRDRFVVGADGVKIIGLSAAWVPEFVWFQFQQLEFEDRGYSRHFQFLRNAPLVLPPLAEQQRIVAEVERRLEVVDRLEALVETNLRRCARLRQSILQRAFSGELVPPAE